MNESKFDSDLTLRKMVAVIVARDSATVSRLLAASPPLAKSSFHSAATRSSAKDSRARGPQHEFERFSRNALDEWSDQPIQAGGNVARQGDRFALNVYAVVGLGKSPVGIQPPQKSAIVSRRQLTFTGFAGILDFGDPRAVRAALRAGCVDRLVMHVVIGIEHNRDDFLAPQADINLEIVSCMLERLRFRHVAAKGIPDRRAIVLLEGRLIRGPR